MKHLPIFLDIKDRHCLVFGGGPVASRKVSNLLRAGAKVTLISPEVDKKIQQKADENKDHFNIQKVSGNRYCQSISGGCRNQQ